MMLKSKRQPNPCDQTGMHYFIIPWISKGMFDREFRSYFLFSNLLEQIDSMNICLT